MQGGREEGGTIRSAAGTNADGERKMRLLTRSGLDSCGTRLGGLSRYLPDRPHTEVPRDGFYW